MPDDCVETSAEAADEAVTPRRRTGDLAAIARRHGLERSATSSRWRGSRPRTPPATSTGRADQRLPLDAHPVEQRRAGVAVGHHAELHLLGADEVAQLEIDVAR